MKLNEILIKNKIVRYEASAPSGKRFVVLDESMNRVISVHATKESAKNSLPTQTTINEQRKRLTESFSFDGRNWPVGSVFQLNAEGTRWGVGLGVADEIIEFEGPRAQAAARALVDNLPSGQTTWDKSSLEAQARRRRMPSGVTARVEQIDLSRLNRAAAVNSFASLENIRNSNRFVGPTLTKILSSPMWRGFSRIGAAVGIPLAIIWTNIGLINDLEEEANNNPDVAQENYELRNIILAQTSVQVLFFLRYVMRTASVFNRALRAIKWTVRSVQGGAALTGVGAIPSALSFLVTEAGWLVAGWIISSPTVQNALAEWIHDSMFSGIFELAGQGVSLALTALDAAFDGRFGTGAARAAIGWESSQPQPNEDGEYASSSEWAKLVFHGLLFPPGRENLLVPYIGPEQRAALLRQTLGMGEEAAPAPTGDSAADVELDDAARTAQPQTSEPGMPVNPDARSGPQ